MALSPDGLSGIIEILNRLYLEILEIEEQFSLRFGNGDFRPRIEYFHDAVRAYTSRNPDVYEPGGRLSVEMLTYDVSCLRYLQNMPLGTIHRETHGRSPGSNLAADVKSTGKSLATGKPDRLTKLRLGELYQQYGVLFAALFKPEADHNYHERTDALNTIVTQLEGILQLMESGAGAQAVQDAMAHVDDLELRSAMLSAVHKNPKKDLKPAIKKASAKTDRDIAALEKAHFSYASAQLAMFEDGRDIVKKMAAKGMNLAGKFVENAMAAARVEISRR